MEVESSTPANISSTRSPNKRSNKPLMERRRRARINNCLTQLKALLLQDMKKEENSHVSKFEKAEILEMTVHKLRKLRDWIQPEDTKSISTKDGGFREHPRYKAGFNDCMNEVVSYLSKKDCVNNEFQIRVVDHLNSCFNKGPNDRVELKQENGNHDTLNRSESTVMTTVKIKEQVESSIRGHETKPFTVHVNQYNNTNNQNRLSPPVPHCIVNGQTNGLIQSMNNQHTVQITTNNVQCKQYVDVISQNRPVNDHQLMEVTTSATPPTTHPVPVNTIDVAELVRQGGQVITGTSNGVPIAFLVATPMPVKAIPLYTSLDKQQQQTGLATLSPSNNVIVTSTGSPVNCLPQDTRDPLRMKTDERIACAVYSTVNQRDIPNKAPSPCVWRPWNSGMK